MRDKRTEFKRRTWINAKRAAEDEVMRRTATIEGGRKPNESLFEYMERARILQEEAYDKYCIADFELRALDGFPGKP